MNNEDVNKVTQAIRKVVKEEVNTALEVALRPIDQKLGTVDKRLGTVDKRLGTVDKRLGTVEEKLDTLWDQTVKLTEDMDEVKETLKSHTASLQTIGLKLENSADNTERIAKRMHTVEDQLGIIPPVELNIVK